MPKKWPTWFVLDQLQGAPQPGAGAGELLIPIIRPSGLKFLLLKSQFFTPDTLSGVKLCCLALIFVGLYQKQMEVSFNSLIRIGLYGQALPDLQSIKSRPFHSVHPAYLQFSISYLLQSTPFLTRIGDKF